MSDEEFSAAKSDVLTPRRQRWLVATICAALATVAIVLIVVLGMSKKSNSASTSDEGTTATQAVTARATIDTEPYLRIAAAQLQQQCGSATGADCLSSKGPQQLALVDEMVREATTNQVLRLCTGPVTDVEITIVTQGTSRTEVIACDAAGR